MNAVKHGLRAQRAVLPDEDEKLYAELVEKLREEFVPSTVIEDELVSQAAAILWKLARARRADREVSIRHACYEQIRIESQDKHERTLDLITGHLTEDEAQRREALIAEADEQSSMAGKVLSSAVEQLEGLSRYEAGLERRLFRLINELRDLQVNRVRAA